MRVLLPDLLAAVRAGSTAPLVRLELIDAAPRYAPIFADGAAGRNAAALAPDGAVVQSYHDGAATVYARRVTDPTVPAWGPWSALTTAAAPGAGVAAARLDDRVRLLWQSSAAAPGGMAVYAADSFDDGATWGAAVALFDPAAPLAGLAADGAAATVFAAYQSAGGAWRVAVWSAGTGVWSGSDWSNGDAYAIAGLGVVRAEDGSYLLAVAAQAAVGTGTALWVCTYAETAGGWGTVDTIVPADVGAGLALSDPRLAHYDGRYHLAYAVVDNGAAAGLPSARTALLHSLDGIHWTDPLEDTGAYAHGATPLRHATGYLLAAPDAAARAPLYTGAPTQYRDLSAAVTRLEVVQKDGAAAHLVVTVQGSDPAVEGYGVPPLRPRATLRLSLGCAGAGAPVPAALFYIDDWSLVRAVDEDEVVLTASDALAWLDRASRTTMLYNAKTVEWLAREIAARAGLLCIDIPTTAQFAYTVPLFSIPAGATWRDALARLGRLYGFDAAVRGAPDGIDRCVLHEKSPADVAVWDFGDTAEQIVIARSADRANHVLVFGAAGTAGAPGAPVGEAWDWADVAATGQERYLHTVEPLITTHAGATLRAQLELRREVRQGSSGSISAPLHPGLEIWDVIAVGSGAAATALRVATLHHIYEPHAGVYDMVLTCEGV